MNKTYFATAILLTAFAVAGFVVWYVDSGMTSTEPAFNPTLASRAFLIGVVSLITAIVSWFTAFRSS